MTEHELFNQGADLYEKYRPTYPREMYDYLASLCVATETAWDCACGNGQVAIDLAEKFNLVYATDVSREQIANAKPHSKIKYSIVTSENTSFLDNSFDLICVAEALHWFDYSKYWPEVMRVLKPGGVFAAWGYVFPSINDVLDSIFYAMILTKLEPYWAAQNALIWNHYRDVDIPFERVETPEFIMQMHWDLDQLFDFIKTFSATRKAVDVIGSEFLHSAYIEMQQHWGKALELRKISFDFVFYVGVRK